MSEARKGKFRVKAVNRRHSKTVKISVFANRIRRGVGSFKALDIFVTLRANAVCADAPAVPSAQTDAV